MLSDHLLPQTGCARMTDGLCGDDRRVCADDRRVCVGMTDGLSADDRQVCVDDRRVCADDRRMCADERDSSHPGREGRSAFEDSAFSRFLIVKWDKSGVSCKDTHAALPESHFS